MLAESTKYALCMVKNSFICLERSGNRQLLNPVLNLYLFFLTLVSCVFFTDSIGLILTLLWGGGSAVALLGLGSEIASRIREGDPEKCLKRILVANKISHIPLFEFDNLLKEYGSFFNSQVPYSDEVFIKFLKHNLKIEALLTLGKLGADKRDCGCYLFQELDAKHCSISNAHFLQSPPPLQWLAANTINQHRGLSTTEISKATNNVIAIVQASKKYC